MVHGSWEETLGLLVEGDRTTEWVVAGLVEDVWDDLAVRTQGAEPAVDVVRVVGAERAAVGIVDGVVKLEDEKEAGVMRAAVGEVGSGFWSISQGLRSCSLMCYQRNLPPHHQNRNGLPLGLIHMGP